MSPKLDACTILMRMEGVNFRRMSDTNRVQKWLVGSDVRSQIRTFAQDC